MIQPGSLGAGILTDSQWSLCCGHEMTAICTRTGETMLSLPFRVEDLVKIMEADS